MSPAARRAIRSRCGGWRADRTARSAATNGPSRTSANDQHAAEQRQARRQQHRRRQRSPKSAVMQIREGLAERQRADQQRRARSRAAIAEPAGGHLHRRRIDAGERDAGQQAQRDRRASAPGATSTAALASGAGQAPSTTARAALSDVGEVDERGEPACRRRSRACTAIVSHDACGRGVSCNSRDERGVTAVAENHSVMPRNSARAMHAELAARRPLGCRPS